MKKFTRVNFFKCFGLKYFKEYKTYPCDYFVTVLPARRKIEKMRKNRPKNNMLSKKCCYYATCDILATIANQLNEGFGLI